MLQWLWGTDASLRCWFMSLGWLPTRKKDWCIIWQVCSPVPEEPLYCFLNNYILVYSHQQCTEISFLRILSNNYCFYFLIIVWHLLLISLPSWSLQSIWTTFTHFKHICNNIRQYITKTRHTLQIFDLETGVTFYGLERQESLSKETYTLNYCQSRIRTSLGSRIKEICVECWPCRL